MKSNERLDRRGVKVGVGIAVIVVHEERVLLGKRKGALGAGTWSVPGGRLEFGEDIEQCARRELAEETGLVAASIQRGPYTNNVYPDADHHDVTLFVLATGICGTPRNLEPDKCEDWSWHRWDALPMPLFQPMKSLASTGYRPDGT